MYEIFLMFPSRAKILEPPLYTVQHILYIYQLSLVPPPQMFVADSMDFGTLLCPFSFDSNRQPIGGPLGGREPAHKIYLRGWPPKIFSKDT